MMNLIVALDLGTSKTAALAAEISDTGTLTPRGYVSVPSKGIRKGIVTDLDDASTSIGEALRELQRSVVDGFDTVVVAVGGPHIEARHVKGFHPIYPKSRPITSDDVLQVINHSRKQLLPPDLEELQTVPHSFTIDGQKGIQKPIGMSGSRLEVDSMLVIGQRAHVQNLETAIERAGKRAEQFVLRSLASGLAVLTPAEMEHGVAVLDLGCGTSELAVFTGGSVSFAASIPVGAQYITSDLMKLLKTSPEESERLKVTYGNAVAALVPPDDTIGVLQLGQIHERPMQRRVLCEIIESRVREIGVFVRQQLEKSGYFGMLPGGIVLTGGGANLPGTIDLFGDLMPGHKMRVAHPKLKGPLASQLNTPEAATVVGLAQFIARSAEEELEPANIVDGESIGGKIKTIWSILKK